MKKLIQFILIAGVCLPSRASNVYFALTNAYGGQSTNAVMVTPVLPTSDGGFLVTGQPQRFPKQGPMPTPYTNWFEVGTYQLQVVSPNNIWSVPVYFTVPNDTNTYNVLSLIGPPISTNNSLFYAYSQAASDLRYAFKGTGGADTNGADTNALQSTNNLSDVASASTARANLGLGTAAQANVGTGANDIPQYDGAGNLAVYDTFTLANGSAFYFDNGFGFLYSQNGGTVSAVTTIPLNGGGTGQTTAIAAITALGGPYQPTNSSLTTLSDGVATPILGTSSTTALAGNTTAATLGAVASSGGAGTNNNFTNVTVAGNGYGVTNLPLWMTTLSDVSSYRISKRIVAAGGTNNPYLTTVIKKNGLLLYYYTSWPGGFSSSTANHAQGYMQPGRNWDEVAAATPILVMPTNAGQGYVAGEPVYSEGGTNYYNFFTGASGGFENNTSMNSQFAWSANGSNWTQFGSPALSRAGSTWHSTSVYYGPVVKWNGIYNWFPAAYNGTWESSGHLTAPSIAGPWTDVSNAFINLGPTNPAVIVNDLVTIWQRRDGTWAGLGRIVTNLSTYSVLSAYTSADLTNWTYLGNLNTVDDTGLFGLTGGGDNGVFGPSVFDNGGWPALCMDDDFHSGSYIALPDSQVGPLQQTATNAVNNIVTVPFMQTLMGPNQVLPANPISTNLATGQTYTNFSSVNWGNVGERAVLLTLGKTYYYSAKDSSGNYLFFYSGTNVDDPTFVSTQAGSTTLGYFVATQTNGMFLNFAANSGTVLDSLFGTLANSATFTGIFNGDYYGNGAGLTNLGSTSGASVTANNTWTGSNNFNSSTISVNDIFANLGYYSAGGSSSVIFPNTQNTGADSAIDFTGSPYTSGAGISFDIPCTNVDSTLSKNFWGYSRVDSSQIVGVGSQSVSSNNPNTGMLFVNNSGAPFIFAPGSPGGNNEHQPMLYIIGTSTQGGHIGFGLTDGTANRVPYGLTLKNNATNVINVPQDAFKLGYDYNTVTGVSTFMQGGVILSNVALTTGAAATLIDTSGHAGATLLQGGNVIVYESQYTAVTPYTPDSVVGFDAGNGNGSGIGYEVGAGSVPLTLYLNLEDVCGASASGAQDWIGQNTTVFADTQADALNSGTSGVYNSVLMDWGSFGAHEVTETGNYALTASDYCVYMNGNSLTATLPDATSHCYGRIYVIKNIAATACTVATTSSQNIDSATSYSLGGQNSYITVQSDGTQWRIISNNNNVTTFGTTTGTITATGWTNTIGTNCMIDYDASSSTITNFDSSKANWRTNSALTGGNYFTIVQPGGGIKASGGLSGTWHVL